MRPTFTPTFYPVLGFTPVTQYAPSPLAVARRNADLPDFTTTFPLFYTASLVTAWQAKAASAPANLSSGDPATKSVAQQWGLAAYLADQVVAGAYPAPPATCTADQYWGNTSFPVTNDTEVSYAALAYRTARMLDGTAASGPVQAARLSAITTWLLNMAACTYLDPGYAGFRTPLTGVSVTNSDTLNVFIFPRIKNWSTLCYVYDMVRVDMSAANRLVVETSLRRVGDWLMQAFSKSSAYGTSYTGKYNLPLGVTATGEYLTIAGDVSSGNRYAYVDNTNTYGPREATASSNYNNRRSDSASALMLIGLILNEPAFYSVAIRYWQEFLQFGVNPDGSVTEWAERAFDYNIPQQGRVYASASVNGYLLSAMCLRRAFANNHLYTFSTASGILATIGGTKTISLVLEVQANLMTRTGTQANWYAVNGKVASAAAQVKNNTTVFGVTQSTHLGATETQYLGGSLGGWPAGTWVDTVHDIAAVYGCEYYTSLGGSVPSGATRTGTVLSGAINAVANRSATLWNTAVGSSPTVMPPWPGTRSINGTATRPDGGQGTILKDVGPGLSYYSYGSADGIVPAVLFKYAP